MKERNRRTVHSASSLQCLIAAIAGTRLQHSRSLANRSNNNHSRRNSRRLGAGRPRLFKTSPGEDNGSPSGISLWMEN